MKLYNFLPVVLLISALTTFNGTASATFPFTERAAIKHTELANRHRSGTTINYGGLVGIGFICTGCCLRRYEF
ncbi:hypothetical protein G9U52_23905 [Paenibacillus sp. S3N08]|uniref:Uncharacterized protein n=1 Tax=Paenibacillus agricola TaxID=2716264 RepID=A0ABX0JGR7_9BACL|nr:hypothetical protein [Paenibacillus agricola]